MIAHLFIIIIISEVSKDAFVIDTTDSRFASLFTNRSGLFGIDRTNNEFKETKAMKQILQKQSQTFTTQLTNSQTMTDTPTDTLTDSQTMRTHRRVDTSQPPKEEHTNSVVVNANNEKHVEVEVEVKNLVNKIKSKYNKAK